VGAALDASPVQSYQDYVIIYVQEASTFSQRIEIEKEHPPVKIIGNGSANTTFSAAGNTLNVVGSAVVIEDIKITGGKQCRVNRNATVLLTGDSTITDMSDRGVVPADGGILYLDSGASIDVSGSGASEAVSAAFGGQFRLLGSVSGGTGAVVQAQDGSAGIVVGPVTGEGAGTTGNGVGVSGGAYVKADSTVSDVGTAAYATAWGGLELGANFSTSNVNFRKQNGNSGPAWILDGPNSERTFSVESWNNPPAPTDLGTGLFEGLIGYNSSKGLGELWSRKFDSWLNVGREVVYDATLTFSSGGSKKAAFGGSVGNVYEVTATPANDPGNDHSYSAQLVVNTANNELRWQVEETVGNGGGDCRIVVHRLL